MNVLSEFATLFVVIFLAIISLKVVDNAVTIGAQLQGTGNVNVTASHKMGVKIISPSANTTVSAGQLTIHGISSDTPNTNCKVSVDWNDLKPMQNVTANGPVQLTIIQIGHLPMMKNIII